ncbi:MAG: glycosyltransferase family 4 protein [Candidatus Kapabacteria bacterium]|nr:glycosyltransferase family 4 protein [Candidatus Kapabacteria bacterium]
MQIALAVNWERDKERTWSYTPYSLLTALQSRSDIRAYDWNLRPHRLIDDVYRAININYNPYSKRLTTAYRASTHYKHRLQSSLRKHEVQTPVDAIIAIGDVGSPTNTPQFLYTDCIAHEYKEMLTDLFTRRMFQSVYSERQLDEACRWQEEILPQQRGIVFMSKSAAEYVRHIPGVQQENVHIIPPGSNTPAETFEYIPPRPLERPYILFIGKEFHRKAGTQVVEAFRILRATTPDIELVIIGPPDYERPQVLPKGVHWLGFVPREQLPAYFHHAEFLCVPSHVEAFGIVFAEALCYGLPVIARDCFAMPDIISDGITGYLLPKHSTSAEELSILMSSALGNSTMKHEVRTRMEESRRYYSWTRVADDFIRVITQSTNT